MAKRNLLLLSSSKLFGHEFLEFAEKEIVEFLKGLNVRSVLFFPYALKDHDEYFSVVQKPFKKWGFEINSIHTQNPVQAINNAEAFFIGGGNTFRLLKTLYDKNLIEIIRNRVLEQGIPYMGASAGSNVATSGINTTNDMPIVYPPSFEALRLVPFNINPHYIDADPKSGHMGESRETRIRQYQEESHSKTVLGMREGCILAIKDNNVIVQGLAGAKLFLKDKDPQEIPVGASLDYLMVENTC